MITGIPALELIRIGFFLSIGFSLIWIIVLILSVIGRIFSK